MPNTSSERVQRLIAAWRAMGLSEAEAKFAVDDIPTVVENWGKEMGRRLGLNEAEASIFGSLFNESRR